MNTKIHLWDSARLQIIFRDLMNAFSYPGSCQKTEIENDATLVEHLLACLVDSQVTLSDEENNIKESFRSLLGAKTRNFENADFIISSGNKTAPSKSPKIGTLESPEHSATLILLTQSLSEGETRWELEGPGICKPFTISISGVNESWFYFRNEHCHSFPLGIDLILCSPSEFCALPRSTKITIKKSL